MKIKYGHILYCLLFTLLASCQDRVTQEELIESALELKMEQWRIEQARECRQKAMTEAEEYVDSILVIYSLPSKLDTIPKPPKPNKPHKPSFRIKPDSVVIDTL